MDGLRFAVAIMLMVGAFLLLATTCDPYFSHELGNAIVEGMRQ